MNMPDSCGSSAVTSSEKGRPVKNELLRVLGPILAQILKEAVEMAYYCGFVAFCVQRRQNINVPPQSLHLLLLRLC